MLAQVEPPSGNQQRMLWEGKNVERETRDFGLKNQRVRHIFLQNKRERDFSFHKMRETGYFCR